MSQALLHVRLKCFIFLAPGDLTDVVPVLRPFANGCAAVSAELC
jgi:hypothetical protein